MKNRIDALKYRKCTVTAVTLLLLAAQENRGFSAYLKQIGPAPLRFSRTTAVPASFMLPTELIERKKPTNTTETAVSPTISTETNAVPAVPIAPPTTNAEPTALSPETPAKPAATPTASEMLVVSPQMLTEFFKPVAESTNTANNIVAPVTTTPLPVGFTPPLAKPGSRATYNTP